MPHVGRRSRKLPPLPSKKKPPHLKNEGLPPGVMPAPAVQAKQNPKQTIGHLATTANEHPAGDEALSDTPAAVPNHTGVTAAQVPQYLFVNTETSTSADPSILDAAELARIAQAAFNYSAANSFPLLPDADAIFVNTQPKTFTAKATTDRALAVVEPKAAMLDALHQLDPDLARYPPDALFPLRFIPHFVDASRQLNTRDQEWANESREQEGHLRSLIHISLVLETGLSSFRTRSMVKDHEDMLFDRIKGEIESKLPTLDADWYDSTGRANDPFVVRLQSLLFHAAVLQPGAFPNHIDPHDFTDDACLECRYWTMEKLLELQVEVYNEIQTCEHLVNSQNDHMDLPDFGRTTFTRL